MARDERMLTDRQWWGLLRCCPDSAVGGTNVSDLSDGAHPAARNAEQSSPFDRRTFPGTGAGYILSTTGRDAAGEGGQSAGCV